MERTRKLAVAALAVAMMTSTAFAKDKRLSLNPYGSQLDADASFVLSTNEAPILLPPDNRPTFYNGFTIPDDYKGGPLTLELLVESEATNCDFHLRPDALYRMRLRGPGELGGAGVDFEGLDASTTPYGLSGHGVVFAAADIAKDSVRVRFEISDEGGNHPFAPGDGIHFGIFRETSGNHDSCYYPLHVGGMSVVYSNSRFGHGPGGYKAR